jgi:hypothetical protein
MKPRMKSVRPLLRPGTVWWRLPLARRARAGRNFLRPSLIKSPGRPPRSHGYQMGKISAALRRQEESDLEVTGRRDRQAPLGDRADGQTRVTPVMPIPDWLRERDHEDQALHTPRGAHPEVDEHEFWDTPPRYSLTNLPSLAPVALRPVPSRWRIWTAQSLFGAILCVVVALLGLEILSLTRHVPPSSAHGDARESVLVGVGTLPSTRP